MQPMQRASSMRATDQRLGWRSRREQPGEGFLHDRAFYALAPPAESPGDAYGAHGFASGAEAGRQWALASASTPP